MIILRLTAFASLVLLLSCCCTQTASSTACCPFALNDATKKIDAREASTELLGFPDKPSLVRGIETELSRRAYADRRNTDLPPDSVRFDERLADKDATFLEKLHQQVVVYGDDDRVDPLAMAAPPSLTLRRNIDSTAAVFLDGDIVPLPDSTGFKIADPAATLADRGVCKTELFTSQPAVSLCSAFLIDEDVVATASDCAESDFDVQGKNYVFGYRLESNGSARTQFTNDEVIRGKALLGRVGVPYVEEWAVVLLEHKVANHTPLPLQVSDVRDRAGVYIIGYPSGLPVKYAPNATVIRNDPNEAFFVADLDAFKGNSGSPVFDAATDAVVGILAGGEIDYFDRGGCSIPTKCPNGPSGCLGEEITRINRVAFKR